MANDRRSVSAAIGQAARLVLTSDPVARNMLVTALPCTARGTRCAATQRVMATTTANQLDNRCLTAKPELGSSRLEQRRPNRDR